MSMSYSEYLKHYFNLVDLIPFLLIAMGLLCIVYLIFFVYSKSVLKEKVRSTEEFFSLSERFYELIFSGGSIIGFMAAYYLINRFVVEGAFYRFWSSYKDYLLLLFMIISIVINSIIDHFIVRLKRLDRDAMASIRLTGMLYMVVIFGYIKFIYEDDNYDMFIAYFLTLMIGRFVYFDASFKDFLHCIKQAAANIPIMIIGLVYLGVMCLYGFNTGYLLKHNGVITNVFFVHVYITVAIFLLHLIPEVVFKNNKPNKKQKHRNARPEIEEDIEIEILDL